MNLAPAQLRKRILEIAYRGSSVHIGCAFSIVEILSVLFTRVLKLNASLGPGHPENDFFILSKGHGVMTLYAVYEALGWLSTQELDRYFQDGSHFHGLVEAKIPGFEVNGGSLGHGFPVAVGMALGLKRKQDPRQIFVLAGDGEMNEGSMWEALLFASHHRLTSLTLVIDANQFQAMGRVEDVLSIEPLQKKLESFGWEALECDGHDVEALCSELRKPKGGRPRALIARTRKGKGVSFMDLNNEWHYRRLTPELYAQALAEVDRHA